MCVYRGAVQSNAGQEDSILSPRDERERERRERERDAAWTGPGRGGVAGRCCKDRHGYVLTWREDYRISCSRSQSPHALGCCRVCPIDIPL